MNNYTINTYEMKRDLINYSKKISKGLNKSTSKLVMDLEYWISKSKSVLISNIGRSLDEKIDLKNTIERLGDNLLLLDDKEEHEISVSHTKVVLPYNNREYELVFVYGLDEEHPMILLTNRGIHSKEDVIKVVRLYFYRWRIEEYFRSKKQEYEFENMRVRTLKAMNNLNLFLTIHMGYLALLAEKSDTKLLVMKII